MKIPLILFSIIVGLLAVLIFVSIGLSRFVRWMGWPQDALAAAGIVFVLLAGLSLSAWRAGMLEDSQDRREKPRLEVENARQPRKAP